MSINLSFKNILILFAVWLVASSKGILIYNEETLVALSFLCFVVFTFRYFGNRIQESLDERTLLIKSEQEHLTSLRESSLNKAAREHKRVGGLKEILDRVSQFTKLEVSKTTHLTEPRLDLINKFNNQISQNLSGFESEKSALSLDVKKSIANTIYTFVLAKFLKNDSNYKKASRKIQIQSTNKDCGTLATSVPTKAKAKMKASVKEKGKVKGKEIVKGKDTSKKKEAKKSATAQFASTAPVGTQDCIVKEKGVIEGKVKGKNNVKGLQASHTGKDVVKDKQKRRAKTQSLTKTTNKGKNSLKEKKKATVAKRS